MAADAAVTRPALRTATPTRRLSRLATFYSEVVAEMRKVTWPDRAQLKDTTIKIIIFVLFIGARHRH